MSVEPHERDLLRENAELRQRLAAAEREAAILRGGFEHRALDQSDALHLLCLTFLQHIPLPAALVDRRGIVRCSNLPFAMLCGQSSTSLSGKPLRNFALRAGRESLDALLAAAWDGDTRGEVDLQPGHGTPRKVSLSAGPIGDRLGGPWLLVVELTARRDNEEGRRLLAHLRASEERLTLAQHVGRIGSFEWRASTDSIIWSTTMEELYGLAPGAFDGSVEHWLRIIHVDDRLRFEAEWRRAFDHRGGLDLEFRIVLPGGEVRWMGCKGRAFPHESQDLRLVGVNQDVTRRRRIEQQFQEADDKKDEFLATLAHELRNPLAPIGNALNVLRMSDVRPEEVAAMYEMMARQLSHLVQLVDDLLEISRITRGHIELRRAVIDIRDAVRDAVEASHHLIDADGHELILDLPDSPLWIDADGVRITQTLTNLLNNAARYTEPGGTIWLRAAAFAGVVQVTVRDTGVGIAAEHRGRIFDVFERGAGGAAQVNGGLGIGLTVVRMLVEMHGGSIVVLSDGAGLGSEFIVTLPLAEADPLRAKDDEPPPTVPRQRILVVDDNRDAADSLGMLLELIGVEVCVAYDGRGALECLESYRAEVVLLDIAMPDMDGIELARRIRDRPQLSGIVLIAMTGWSEDELSRRGGRADFDVHLIKPVSAAVLVNTLGALPGQRADDTPD